MALIALHTGDDDFDVHEPLRRLLTRRIADGRDTPGERSDLNVVSTAPGAWRGPDAPLLREQGALHTVDREGPSRADILAEVVSDMIRRQSTLSSEDGDDSLVVLVPIVAGEGLLDDPLGSLNAWLDEVVDHFSTRHTVTGGFLPEADDIRVVPWLYAAETPDDDRWPRALFESDAEERTPHLSQWNRTPLVHTSALSGGGTRSWDDVAQLLETELTSLATLSERPQTFQEVVRATPLKKRRAYEWWNVQSAHIELPLRAHTRRTVLRRLRASETADDSPDSHLEHALPDPSGLDTLANRVDLDEELRSTVDGFESELERDGLDLERYRFPDGAFWSESGPWRDRITRIGPRESEVERRWPGVLDYEWPFVAPPLRTPALVDRLEEALARAHDELLSEWVSKEIQKVHARIWGAEGESGGTPAAERVQRGLVDSFDRAETIREGVGRALSFLNEVDRSLDSDAGNRTDGSSSAPADPEQALASVFDTWRERWPEDELELIEQSHHHPSMGAVALEMLAVLSASLAVGTLVGWTVVGFVACAAIGVALAGAILWLRRDQLRDYLGEHREPPPPRSWEHAREAWRDRVNEEAFPIVIDEIERQVGRARVAATTDFRTRLETVDHHLRTEVQGLGHLMSERYRILDRRLDELSADATSSFLVEIEPPEVSLDTQKLKRELLALWRPSFRVAEMPTAVSITDYETLVENQVESVLERATRRDLLSDTEDDDLETSIRTFVDFASDTSHFSSLVGGDRISDQGPRFVAGCDAELTRWDVSPEKMAVDVADRVPQIDLQHTWSIESGHDEPTPPDVAWGLLMRKARLEPGADLYE